jgi:hypothetical protein
VSEGVLLMADSFLWLRVGRSPSFPCRATRARARVRFRSASRYRGKLGNPAGGLVTSTLPPVGIMSGAVPGADDSIS